MRQITRAVWTRTHADFRGQLPDGTRTMLSLNRTTGGTELVPVEIVETVRPADCAHAHVRVSAEGSATVYAWCQNCAARLETELPAWRTFVGDGFTSAEDLFLAAFPPAREN